MATDAQKYGATAEHEAVSVETSVGRLDDEARTALAGIVSGPLAALAGDSSDTEESVDLDEEVLDDTEEKVEDEKDEKDDTEEEVEDDTEEEVEDEVERESTDSDEAVVDETDESSAPTLPAAYRRSLKAYGWEDADIEAALQHDETAFTLTAMKIHKTRNDEIAKFAEQGRRLRQDAGNRTPESETPKSPTAAELKTIDTDALIEKYGNEEIVMAMAAPMNAAIAEMQALMPEVRKSVASAKRTQQEALGKAIDTFFGGTDMEPYSELYGKPGIRTPEQTEKFDGVLELADAILAGAAEQGRKLSFEDAMESAHSDVSKGFTKTAVRTEIKKSIKKRGGSLTLKPSKGGKTPKAGQPKTQKQLEVRVQAALSKAFS